MVLAWRKAARGKRGTASVARFEYRAEENLAELRDQLLAGTYRPGAYVHFHIKEPKRRKISAAPFRDRVVHHALCNLIEPRFERIFTPDSYANRLGKGTHKAIERLQGLARRHRYVLRADIVQHFASIDHEILLATLGRRIPEPDVMRLVEAIAASGRGVLDEEYRYVHFPGDDLLAICRPRGLPIGNLTSQFWSNCYLHPFDEFVKRGLGCRAYLRYVDDFALFGDSKRQLWAWKAAIVERLARLRLVIHETRAQVQPVGAGIPWLGFVVFPNHRLVKARKLRNTHRRLRSRLAAYHAGEISFAELDASIGGWIAHVAHADTWGLRGHVLDTLPIRPAEHRRAIAARQGEVGAYEGRTWR
ncbi:MAG: reverse transcriptase/maturase family protein [Kiloniellales bacterium]|nr:reverse transcriptase/maturase family protein [Kiloniellales bacterium]